MGDYVIGCKKDAEIWLRVLEYLLDATQSSIQNKNKMQNILNKKALHRRIKKDLVRGVVFMEGYTYEVEKKKEACERLTYLSHVSHPLIIGR